MHKSIKTVFSIVALIALVLNLAPSNASALDPVQIRWFVGLGTGSDPSQIAAEEEVVADFNAAQSDIELILEVVPTDQARAILADQIANGNGPDVVGPVGWGGSNAFHDEWLDLEPLITAASYDTGQFPEELVDMYQTDIGQEALPFALFPAAIYFNAPLFVEAGLYYPPSRYGEQYEMPDGTMVDWNWDTIATIGKLLTLDINGRNATEVGFDNNNIVQYGFTFQWQHHPNYWGSYWESGSMLAPGGTPGNYQAQTPNAWNAAWEWIYNGMWGSQPFMPNGPAWENLDGNVFNSGKVAMAEVPIWYTCCLGDVSAWEAAAMPNYNGQVAGRIDADTFRILKDSQYPEEAFTVLTYLIGEGVQKLVIGSDDNPPAYGGVPARTSDYQAWRVARHQQFPWVQNWRTVLSGFDYPDTPNAEGWLPNFNRSWGRGQEFADLLMYTDSLDLNTEVTNLQADLEMIFNSSPPTDISLSDNNIDEGQPAGTQVGILSTTDGNPDFGYSFCGGADDSAFQINGDSLETAQRFDFETTNSYSVCIRSTDNLGLDTLKLFTITVNDLFETTTTFTSAGGQDGWVLESTETSNKGGTLNTAATLLYIGDNAQDKQYKSIVSFNTDSLPENAFITTVQLKINIQGFAGGNMFTPNKPLGNLLVDITQPCFGSNANLAINDFQATPQNDVGTLDLVSGTGWYTITLVDASFPSINLEGTTQLRLRFTKDDNNDMSADYLKIYSGNTGAASRPQLIIEYYEQ